MPPRLNLTSRSAISALRQPHQSSQKAAPSHINWQNGAASTVCIRFGPSALVQRRMNSSNSGTKDLPPEPEQPKGHTQDQLPHASEEAAAIDKVMSGRKCDGSGPGAPELEQGTPVDEILRRDKDALKYAPKVFQDQIKKGSRSYTTSARLRQELQDTPSGDSSSASVVAGMIAQATQNAVDQNPGLKFHMPEPLSRTEHVKHRYDPVVDQFTKLIMWDGKLSMAQKNMAFILDHLRTASPPAVDPERRLLTTLPAAQLPLNPVLYLNIIVDSIAPLIKLRQQKGLVGGGVSVQIPVPLAMRQRRRTAIMWILDSANRRRDSSLAVRVANELTAVAEGRSGIWEKREQVHKLGVAGRSNLKPMIPGR